MRLTALVLAALVLLSRLPLLSSGLGDDPDGYRVSIAAKHLAEFGQYVPSRPPGYPLPEYLDALLAHFVPINPFLLNLPAAIASAVASSIIVLMLARFGLVRALIVATTFAFTPAVFKASTLPLDYMLGFMFFASALYCAAEKRTVGFAAVCLGLAAACRPTYALAIIPVALASRGSFGWWPIPKADRWRLLTLCVVSGVTAIIFYSPLFIRSGLAWLTFADHGVEITHLLLHGSLDLFGLLGSLAILYALVVSVLRRSIDLRLLLQDRLGLALLVTSLLYFILFLRLPDQPYYLIPALPGVYLSIAVARHRAPSFVMSASVVLSCFLGSVEQDQAGAVHLQVAGPLAKRLATEARWACMGRKVAGVLSANQDSYVVAAYLAPTLLARDQPPPAQRVLYLATPTDGGWRTAAGQSIDGGTMYVVDAALKAQDRFVPGSLSRMERLDTSSCAREAASDAP